MAKIEPLLPDRRGQWGGIARDNRRFVNAFLKMKEWRGIVTRYAKRLSSFLAFVQLRCAFMWLKAIS